MGDQIDFVLPDGTVFPVQKTLNNAPVTRTVRELLQWLAAHNKLGPAPLDVNALILTDEDGQLFEVGNARIGDFKRSKLNIARPATSHRNLPPPPAPPTLQRTSTVRSSPGAGTSSLPPPPSAPSTAAASTAAPPSKSGAPARTPPVSPPVSNVVSPRSGTSTPPDSLASSTTIPASSSNASSKPETSPPATPAAFQIGRSRKTLEEGLSPPPPAKSNLNPSPRERVVTFADDSDYSQSEGAEGSTGGGRSSNKGWSQGVVGAAPTAAPLRPSKPHSEKTSPLASPRPLNVETSEDRSEGGVTPTSPRGVAPAPISGSASTTTNRRALPSRQPGINRVPSGTDPLAKDSVKEKPTPLSSSTGASGHTRVNSGSVRPKSVFLLPAQTSESDSSMDDKKRADLNSFLFELKGCQVLLVEELRMRGESIAPPVEPISSKKDETAASKIEAAASSNKSKVDKEALEYLSQLYDRLRDPSAGVETKSRQMKFSPFGSSKKFFMNKDLVEWLLKEDSKSRADAVKLGEALQSLSVIQAKTKGQNFADDENYSKFNLPDEFVLSDTVALQNLYVHRSRSKLQHSTATNSSSAAAVLSPRPSRAKLTKAESDETKPDRGRLLGINEEDGLRGSQKRERSPVRKVNSTSRATVSVHENQLKILFEAPPSVLIVPFATMDTITVRSIASFEPPVLEFSSWDMRRVFVCPDPNEDVDRVCQRIADVVQRFHVALADVAVVEPSALAFVNDPLFDLSSPESPLSSSPWRIFDRKTRTSPGNFRDIVLPISIENAVVAHLMVAWAGSQYPFLSWARVNTVAKENGPLTAILRSARPNGFDDGVSQVKFVALTPLLNSSEIVLSLDYVHLLHQSVFGSEGRSTSKLLVLDTGAKCDPLAEAFDSVCSFQFLESPDAEALRKIYSKTRRLSSPFMKTFGPYFYQVESSGYVDAMKHYLESANAVAEQIRSGSSVLLVEGRPGTFNAALISALSQVMIDARYRSPEGFTALFCKEFLKFNRPASQVFNGAWVEVFLFLSSVAHLLQHNPGSFAFSKTFLLEFLNSIYQFGLHKTPNPLASFVKHLATLSGAGSPLLKNPGFLNACPNSPLPWFDYLLQFNSGVSSLRESLKTEFVTASSAKEATVKLTGGVSFPDLNLPTVTSIFLNDGSFWTLPDSFSALQSLSTLSLDGNRISVLPAVLTRLPNLTTLSLMKNRLSSVPNLSDLINLKTFSARLNQITSIDGLCGVKSLTALQLEGNQLRSLPGHLKNLTNLLRLDLSSNKIAHVSGKILSALTKLQYLSLSGNQLVLGPSSLPLSLSELYLQNNTISIFPHEMFSSLHLTTLDASDNALESLPAEIGQLQELKFLNLKHNALDSIPVEMNKCRLLEDLGLAKNRIAVIPPWLYQLHSLRRLDLDSNRISKVTSALGQLKTLKMLNLANNHIDTIPLPLGLLAGTLVELDLRGNKLNHEVMAEVEKGTASFLGFLKGRLSEDYVLYRVNVMIVGPEKSGKSHIFQNLCAHWDSEEQAMRKPLHFDGVDVKAFVFDLADEARSAFKLPLPFFGSQSSNSVKLKKTKEEASINRTVTKRSLTGGEEAGAPPSGSSSQSLKITSNQSILMAADSKRPKAVVTLWDFSGSPVFQALDRFFFVKSSIYLLVVNLKETNVEASVVYWFNSVQSQVSHPTVLLIGTRKDELAKDSKPTVIMENLVKKLQGHDPKSSISYVLTSGIEDDNHSLIAQIQGAMAKFSDFGRSVPASHIFFEQLLKDYAETLDYPLITQQTLLRLGDACGLGKRKDILAVTKFLHSLGSILYFDEVAALKDVVFLDPLWLYGAMVSAFGEGSSSVRNGVANRQALNHVFKRFDTKLHAQLRTLLVKLEIAFEISGDVDSLGTLIQHSSGGAGTANAFPAASQGKGLALVKKSGSVDMAARRKMSLVSPLEPVEAAGQEKDNSGLLLPSQLPSGYPVTLIGELWKYPPKDSSEIHLDRLFIFDFLPPGLFPSILVRVLKNVETLKALWRNGLMGVFSQHGSSATVFIWQTFSKLNFNQLDTTAGSHYNTIRLEVRGSDLAKLRDVFTILLDTLTAIMSEYKRVTVKEFVLNPRSFTWPTFLVVPMEEIETHIRRGLIKLPDDSNTGFDVTFESLVPDIMLTFYRGLREKFASFKLTGDLGEGGFAFVKKADYQGKAAALKLIKLPEGGNSSLDRARALAEFRREVFAQSSFSHPNLLPILAICLDPLSVAMELCKFGDLNKYLAKPDASYSWALALKIARDIGAGLRYMQSLTPPWAHLDIKTPNILLKSNNPADLACALITDFGTCSRSSQQFTMRFVDNPTWLAPEILLSEPYDHKADTYAYGVILWELITRSMYFGEVLWDGEKQDRIAAGDRPAIPEACPDEYRRCIRACWEQDPQKRPLLDEVVPVMDALKSCAAEFDKSCPIPVPSPPAQPEPSAPSPAVDEPNKPVPSNSKKAPNLAEMEHVVCLVVDAAMDGGEIAKASFALKKDNPKFALLQYRNFSDFLEFFNSEGVRVSNKLKIVTGALRKDDALPKFVEEVVKGMEADSKKSAVPLLVCVPNSGPYMHLRRKGVSFCHDVGDIRKFVFED